MKYGTEQNGRGEPGCDAVGAEAGELRVEEHVTEIGGYSMYSLQAGSGQPLILLHGLLGAAACWRAVMLGLAHGARVYAVDALGIGRSARVPGLDASLRAAAERLRAFMDQEGIASADICATSHGGAVAMFFAATYPARVRSLVLQAPANPFCSKSRPQIRLFCSRVGRWMAHGVPWAPRRLQAIALDRMYGDPKRVGAAALDPYIESLRKAIGSELAMMPGLGHVPYEERPVEFAERVMSFLASVQGEGKQSGAMAAP